MKYLCGRCIHIDACLIPRSTGCVEECKYFKEMPSHLPKQTNEEWLRSATFEELAGAIYEWHTKGYARGRLEVDLNPITEVVEWLKQPKE